MADRSSMLDHILVQCLQAIEEEGATIEDCLSRHAAYRDDLEPMLLAVLRVRQLRALPSSEEFRQRSPARLQARLANSLRPPLPDSVTKQPIQGRELIAFSRWLNRLILGKRGEVTMPRRQLWLAGTMALVGVIIVAAVVFAQPEYAQATLVVSEGQATVTQKDTVLLMISTQSETVLSTGDAIAMRAGDSLVLDADSTAQLRLLDGSTVDLSAGTSLEVRDLQTSTDAGPYHVRLHQLAGRTYNRVQRLLGAGDTYELSTPSSTATVRGTSFAVEVRGSETSYYAIDEGVVAVQLGDEVLEVPAGQEVTATVGEPLQVKLQVDVTSPSLTMLSPAELPAPGETVTVSGQTEAGAAVTVAGEPVAVDANGHFETQIITGDAPVIIEAMDEAGNVTRIQIE